MDFLLIGDARSGPSEFAEEIVAKQYLDAFMVFLLGEKGARRYAETGGTVCRCDPPHAERSPAEHFEALTGREAPSPRPSGRPGNTERVTAAMRVRRARERKEVAPATEVDTASGRR